MTPSVTLDERARENGLATMLADLITQNLEAHPGKRKAFSRLKTTVGISAPDAGVRLTIFFNRGSCVIYDGTVGEPRIQIEADSENILKLSALPLRAGLPRPFSPETREVLKKALNGEIRLRGALSHPCALILLTNILSVA
ncbi:MAG: hypothetical protein GYA21_12080 [Myxococcales bacterium]|nr:hypothetical protein [Myxococcales bacterium]